MRVVGCARLSRASEDSTSIAKQREILTKTAEARGSDLVAIEADEDSSAARTRLDRPGLTSARRRVATSSRAPLLAAGAGRALCRRYGDAPGRRASGDQRDGASRHDDPNGSGDGRDSPGFRGTGVCDPASAHGPRRRS